ncbi:DMT family transporter [Ureibacillus thermophilus]|uniref:EamA family transporter n=1 Tax=Ureibacillus thermophilus TaxID=367743 RepID=A0A4P6UQW4_9BACL|nr:DMT family transporter [Ureibacillus thermophilus]QBK25364.1 EamA family transporter [Ureibacillus thermophilus]
MTENKKQLVSYILLALLIIIWGVSWPIYKHGVQFMPPLLFSGIRSFIAGSLLFLFAWKLRHAIRFKEHWKFYVISAILNNILYLGLQTVGMVYLPGGLFSVLVYIQPVILGILSWWLLNENLTIAKIFGLLLGFTGIVLVSIDGLMIHLSAIGIILALATALAWASGVVFVKKLKARIDFYWMVVMQLILGGGTLLVSGYFLEDVHSIIWNVDLISTILWGGTAGMAAGQVIYFKLMNEGEASKVGSYTFLVPIISVVVSAIFLDEAITKNLLFGMLLVGASIYLVNSKEKRVADN